MLSAVSTWRIRWSGWLDLPEGGPPHPELGVFAEDGRPTGLTYSLWLSWEALTIQENLLTNPTDDVAARIREAVLVLNVERLEELLRAEGLAGEVGRRRVERLLSSASAEDMESVEATARSQKRCDYQERERQGLACTAAADDDPSATRGSYAPTNNRLCAECGLPDARLICAHLTWPQVTAIVTDQEGVVRRDLIGAMCALGNTEVQDSGRCRCAGHRCWERLVQQEDPRQHRDVGPLSLHHALDDLSLAWRAWRGRGERLFDHRATEPVGGVALGCESRAEFGQRLNEVDTVLQAMVIPAPPRTPVEPEAKSLVRLKAYLSDALEDAGNDAAVIARMTAAVGRLRRINDVRVAFEHPGAARVAVAEALAHFQVPYPVHDWQAAWDAVRTDAVDALLTLGDVIRRMT